MTDTPLPDDVVERVAEAIGDFLDERFPDGAMPGGQQLFATDHLDAEFKHEAGCDALARAALEAARYGEMVEALTQLATTEQDSLEHALAIGQARALLSSIGASRP